LTTPALFRRRRDPDGDRLATAIFVVALAHGLLILGIRFSAPPREPSLPTLEVLLVPSGPDDPQANLDAAYIAQRTQQGTGTGDDARRASLPEAREERLAGPDPATADEDQELLDPAEPEGAVSVLARRALEAERLATGVEPRPEPPVFQALPSPAVPTVGLNAAVADRDLSLRGQRSADGKLLADTRESAIAAYLDSWKRRIERVGTINFPNEARRRDLSGNPVVEVAIRANGTLESVVIRRSSGHRELDNAAVGIVRLAAPFEPFPNALRERYPVLRFAYEWQFMNGRLGGDGAVFSSDR
jgi:protein TonB